MRWTAFRVGAIAWVFTGVAHDILEFVLPVDPELTAAMRASNIQVGPATLNAELLNRGVSLAMGLTMIVVGVLLWMIADLVRSGPERGLRFGVVALVSSAALLAVAVVLIPGPPLVTFTVATIAFAVALAPRRARSQAQGGAVS
ncbi:LIC_13387 family protein [Occultella gossypii]|uniref:Uncharacterized protein n=1 Tax=Occultella gossypii TaxID=2800820 RepID=A0ABS7SFL2_9MICO|nr:hypothetical protein [Occultella gossypii]MBZ2198549.1 hypothetical protein [Occultella gossypii]